MKMIFFEQVAGLQIKDTLQINIQAQEGGTLELFINSALANVGASLLWQLFREGMLFNRDFFLNLKDFRTLPLTVA